MPAHLDEGISVVIANWNGGGHILDCLSSLYEQSRRPDEIVIVDNGSTDGSPFLVRQKFPDAKLLTRPLNEGFCVGYNRAIAASRHPFVLILNSDVFLDPSFLAKALVAAKEDDRIGWVCGRVWGMREGQPDFSGCYLRRRIALASGEGTTTGDVFAGSGATIFCRRTMLDDLAIHGEVYDEAYFAYIEDLDLAWRAQLRGWRCVYRDEISCRHIGSASQGGRVRVLDKSVLFLTHILKNRYLTLIKNATPGIAVRFFAPFVLGELAIWMALITRHPVRARAIPSAIAGAVRLIPQTLKKRRHVMLRQTTSDRHLLGLTRGIW